MNISNVQLVGGHADGTELSVIDLPEKLTFRHLHIPESAYVYGDWSPRASIYEEVYELLPGTTVYVFSKRWRIE